MSPPTAPRPTQVTFAGWLTIAASVLAVVLAFAQVSKVGSTDTQEAISQFLDTSLGRSLGLSLAGAQDLLRVIATAAAALAAATAVLGWFVLQRSRGSRLALSVLAAPLLLAGLSSGGVASAVVAASATMLWVPPARGWFSERSGSSSTSPSTSPSTSSVAAEPGATPPSPAPTAPYPPPEAAHPAASYYGGPAAPGRPGRRPPAVVWACVLTWLFTAAVAGLLVVTAVELAVQPDRLLDEAYRQNPDLAAQGLSRSSIEAAVYVLVGIAVVWSVLAAVAAVLAFRGTRWAMVVLLASAVLAGGLSLLLAVGSLVTLVVVLACGVTVALMLRPEVRHWYAAPRRPS